MTTLFSLFAPIFMMMKVKMAIFILGFLALFLWGVVCMMFIKTISTSWVSQTSMMLFPINSSYSIILFSLFTALSLLNLFSLMIYSYPLTTTLGFNLSAALSCWMTSIFIQMMKFKSLSSLLPLNSPWYLIPFLCLVELISISVRPITLCFRLLANMTAGHVLISLICKMPFVWTIGSLFGVLELMVSVVQGFVFSMLIMVYMDESFSH